jgi:exopolysaccharide biosynthesis operon protein EpsL
LRWINCRSAALAAAAGALACAPAAVAQERLFSASASYGVSSDDNVFRLPDAAPDPEAARGIAGKSDRYSTAAVGLHMNLPVSLQRFTLDLTRAAIRYEKFTSRDQDPLSYRGAWLWQATSRLGGALSASRGETLVNVEDAQGRRRIDQRTTTLSGSADARLWGGWYLRGALTDSETKYDPPNLAQPDTSQTSTEAGLRYVAPSASELALVYRRIRGTETIGELGLFGGSDFTQDETELSASWVPTGHSTLRARITQVERHNELLPQRDFSGNTGELRRAWPATAKLNFDWWISRAVTPYNLSLQSTSRVDDTIAAALLWRANERLSFRSSLSRQKSRYGQISTAFEARRDTTDTVELGTSWAPHRNISFDARLRHEERDSSDPLQIFDANVASLSFSLRF